VRFFCFSPRFPRRGAVRKKFFRIFQIFSKTARIGARRKRRKCYDTAAGEKAAGEETL
jgi:hypothetical protein